MSRFTLIEDATMHLEAEEREGFYFLHLELFTWSKEFFKIYREMFEDIKELFRAEGEDTLYIIIPDNDKKLLKFERMFGWEILAHCKGSYLMYLEI